MISFVISACLIADPGQCKDHTFPLDAEYDQTSCMMQAPPYIAKWADEHPAWSVKAWRCAPSDEKGI